MAVRFPGFLFSQHTKQASWFARVRENLGQLLTPIRLTAFPANGAPLHVLDVKGRYAGGQAQTYSAVAHATVVALLLFLATETKNRPMHRPGDASRSDEILRLGPASLANLFEHPSLGRRGGGGNENPTPTTRGNLATYAPVQLLAPHLPHNANPELPVPVTILDTDAPPVTAVVANLGLPWMPAETDSPGPGKNHGIGAGPGHGMGDDDGTGAGRGNDNGPYANVVSWPVCSYCPDPTYSEEAQKEKLQGTVTLRVLVTAEGRAGEVRVVKGLSRDLDERAAQIVRGWRFVPARDASRRGVPAWMTVEVIYRLF